MMTFLLIGIGGVYNYGCEAIIRGTEKILRSEWPDVRIIYASNCQQYDEKRLSGTQVEVIRRKTNNGLIHKLQNKILPHINFAWTPKSDSLSLLEGVDAVLSIGGDIYTLWADGRYNVRLTKFGDAAESRGIKYVLWGASVGPFTRSPKAEQFFKKHLSKVSLVTAREKNTIDYLASIGITSNVFPCADPAFVVDPQINKKTCASCGGPRIGVNLSPFSLNNAGIDYEKGIGMQARAIEGLIDSFDAQILLIPHVVCKDNVHDDDLWYLRRVHENITSKYSGVVHLVDSDEGFIGIKKTLVECDIIVAARMHCAINALSCLVPTIFLSYSQKSYGMCEYVYGHRDWVMPLQDFCAEGCIRFVSRMLEEKTDIHKFLEHRIDDVRRDAYGVINHLKALNGMKELIVA